MNKKSGLADSPFFVSPAPISPKPETPSDANERTPVRTPERSNTRTVERVNARTSERKIIRHSFQIYEDQLEQMRKLVAMKAIAGEKLQLSDIAKAALDDYLNRHKN